MHHLNFYTSKPPKVLDLTRNDVKKSYPVKIETKEEEKFRIMDHILDNEIDSFIILLSENDNANDSWDEM